MNIIFNENILRIHREYAALNLHKSDFLIEFAANDIIDHVSQIDKEFQDVLELGARVGSLTRLLEKNIKSNKISVTDISQKMLDQNPSQHKILTSGDIVPFQHNSFDLVASSMNLHWVNNVQFFIKQIYEVTKKHGVFIGNFIGAGSLRGLKMLLIDVESKARVHHGVHVIPLISAEDCYRLFQQAGFEFIVVDTTNIELEYDNPIKLMKELKNMGENNALSSGVGPLPREIFNYKDKFEDKINLVTVIAKR